MHYPSAKAQLYCALLLINTALIAVGAEKIEFSFAQPRPVGVAGTEAELVIHLQNRRETEVALTFSTRLWQQSSATLQPLGKAVPCWSGAVKAAGGSDVPVNVTYPKVRTATMLQLQLLQEDGVTLAKLPLVAIPVDWFHDQLEGLPEALAVFDEAVRITPGLRTLGARFTAMPTLDALKNSPSRLMVLIGTPENQAVLENTARELAANGRAIAVVGAVPEPGNPGRFACGVLAEFTDLESSAEAQYRFIELLRRATGIKASAPVSPAP
ncbi:MAG: hypothetical protein JWL59_2110 [Chthoniobacteraceae bacterium]|nr:hypothetical protein [Chthoniobacteraceae bacterium]